MKPKRILLFFLLDMLLALAAVLAITSCSNPVGVDPFDQALANIMAQRASAQMQKEAHQ